MKKIVIMLLAMLTVGILPAQAQTTPELDSLLADTTVRELSQLAYFIPEDAPIYIATRTDPGFIETLDGLGERITALAGFPVETPFSAMLDDEAMSIDPQGDFDSLFRSWLGDFAAIAPISSDQFASTGELYAFLSVTDELAASKYLNLLIESSGYEGEYTISEMAGGTLYEAPEDAPWLGSYWLSSNVLVMSDSSYDGFQYQPDMITLADTDAFLDTLALLPAPGYNAIAYFNLPQLINVVAGEMNMEELTMFPGMDFEAMMGAVGPQAWGAVILEERSLTLDFVQSVDIAAMEAAGFPGGNMTPLNPDFTQYIPVNSALVIQDTNLGGSIDQTLNMLSTLGQAASEAAEKSQEEFGYVSDTEQQFAMLDEMATFLRLSYQGLSGAPLDESVAWMSEDYAMYLGFPTVEGSVTVDAGTAIAVNDTAAVDSFAQGLRRILDSWGVAYEDEGGLLTISSVRQLAERALAAQSMNDESELTLPNLDVLFGYNEDVFVLGTRPSVESALNGGAGLPDSDVYQIARRYMLPDTQILAYVDGAILTTGLEALAAADMGGNDLEELATLTSIIESASITANYSEDGIGMVRFVITLAE